MTHYSPWSNHIFFGKSRGNGRFFTYFSNTNTKENFTTYSVQLLFRCYVYTSIISHQFFQCSLENEIYCFYEQYYIFLPFALIGYMDFIEGSYGSRPHWMNQNNELLRKRGSRSRGLGLPMSLSYCMENGGCFN